MDDLFDSRDSGAIDLARRLEAFAEARLTPSVASRLGVRRAPAYASRRLRSSNMALSLRSIASWNIS